jgi:hypothetical protein
MEGVEARAAGEGGGVKFGKLISTADVAIALDISHYQARSWLKESGACVKHGGRYYTTRHKLREAFPDIYDEIMAGMLDDDDS